MDNFVNLFNQWKSRVRVSQLEREKEQTDHALMLRELQKMLADERIAREQVEHKVTFYVS